MSFMRPSAGGAVHRHFPGFVKFRADIGAGDRIHGSCLRRGLYSRLPFGSVKQSDLGREGSRHGMQEYVTRKFLYIGDILK